jgi:predicted ATP-binding protein involved in virulence
MELQLKNIGMIKEANVKIDGLTVIAGENDTGKSTVGKALYLALKSMPDRDENENLLNLFRQVGISLLFDVENFPDNSRLEILKDNKKYIYDCQNPIFNISDGEAHDLKKDDVGIDEIIFIETPIIWNFMKLLNEIPLLESTMKVFINYPYFIKDLHLKLSFKNELNGLDIKSEINSLINGNFQQDEDSNFFFNKNGKRIELVNTATGIKYFGIFQVLSQNNYLNKNTVLVLDEPEVHLHPKWQLEMAKIIVELVKNGVKILVNSHSPYMIEALQRYSELEKVNSDFYLAEDGYINKVNDSNAQTLEKIFEKLSEPFDVFEEMDSQSMEKLING